MRFRFPRFAPGIYSEGIDDNVRAKIVDGRGQSRLIRNPRFKSEIRAESPLLMQHPELWSGDLSRVNDGERTRLLTRHAPLSI
jgi:hypothetical protein